MAVFYALLAAALSGTGDFLGALASRHGRVHAVVAGSHVAGLATAILLAPIIPSDPIRSDFGWGALAGVAGALAVLALYTGFTKSHVAVVSPVAAVGAAATGVIFALITGERPNGLQIAGVALGLVSIYLISRSPITKDDTIATGLGFGALAGLGFGSMLVFLSLVSESSGAWPLIPARAAGSAVIFAIVLRMRAAIWPHRASIVPLVAAGALTLIGNGFFILAEQRGSLAVVAVLASMFPATAVVLARIFFHERISPTRLLGLVGALGAIGLIAAG